MVVGSTVAAVSLAVEAREGGVEQVAIASDGIGAPIGAPESHPDIEILLGPISQISPDAGEVSLTVGDQEIRASAVAVVEAVPEADDLPLQLPATLRDRVHLNRIPDGAWDADVLVVGGSEKAAEWAVDLAGAGAGVVLARGNSPQSELSRLTRANVLLREAERRLTVLWHSQPVAVTDLAGDPLVEFDDASMPDLVFDHVVWVQDLPIADAPDGGPIWTVGTGALAPGAAWEAIRVGSFPGLTPPPPSSATTDEALLEELRTAHYNSTITHFHRTHSDLWVIRVKPDRGDVSHEPGQYASLGLGYWEPRSDGLRDPALERKWEKMVRRSYSISSPVFDEQGYLADPARADTLEFYIVLVPAGPDRIPGLTPRLALRGPGDRIYVGPRIVGRYTLAPVTDPETTVVFFATGTGEAPHNAMITELLRKGHHGPIVSVVSVRYRDDLAYLDVHRRLESRFTNYHYLPLVTRDPAVEKLYVQDVVKRRLLMEQYGIELDPKATHIFLCGNPAMIGLPGWEDDQPVFPESVGTCQLLHELGFDLDRHGHVGNVHSEKYW